MTVTGTRVAGSTPAGISKKPETASPRAAAMGPTLKTSACARARIGRHSTATASAIDVRITLSPLWSARTGGRSYLLQLSKPTGRLFSSSRSRVKGEKSMESSVRITFRHLEHSDALQQHIEAAAGKLEEFFKPILDCHVVVDLPNRTYQGGQPYR